MRFMALFLSLGLAACTTVPTQTDIEGKVESWLGMNTSAIKEIWGTPTQEVKVGQDTKVVQFVSDEGQGACRVVLTLNQKSEVTATKWTGPNAECANFVKASPTYAQGMGEDTNMAILEAIDNVKNF